MNITKAHVVFIGVVGIIGASIYFHDASILWALIIPALIIDNLDSKNEEV